MWTSSISPTFYPLPSDDGVRSDVEVADASPLLPSAIIFEFPSFTFVGFGMRLSIRGECHIVSPPSLPLSTPLTQDTQCVGSLYSVILTSTLIWRVDNLGGKRSSFTIWRRREMRIFHEIGVETEMSERRGFCCYGEPDRG